MTQPIPTTAPEPAAADAQAIEAARVVHTLFAHGVTAAARDNADMCRRASDNLAAFASHHGGGGRQRGSRLRWRSRDDRPFGFATVQDARERLLNRDLRASAVAHTRSLLHSGDWGDPAPVAALWRAGELKEVAYELSHPVSGDVSRPPSTNITDHDRRFWHVVVVAYDAVRRDLDALPGSEGLRRARDQVGDLWSFNLRVLKHFQRAGMEPDPPRARFGTSLTSQQNEFLAGKLPQATQSVGWHRAESQVADVLRYAVDNTALAEFWQARQLRNVSHFLPPPAPSPTPPEVGSGRSNSSDTLVAGVTPANRVTTLPAATISAATLVSSTDLPPGAPQPPGGPPRPATPGRGPSGTPPAAPAP